MEQLNPNTFIPIGTIGIIRERTVKITPSEICVGCVFSLSGLCTGKICASGVRKDSTSIIFKRIE